MGTEKKIKVAREQGRRKGYVWNSKEGRMTRGGKDIEV